VVYIVTTAKERYITPQQRTQQFDQHVLHIHGLQPINEARTCSNKQDCQPQTVHVARMGELKNETASTSEVNNLRGLDWV